MSDPVRLVIADDAEQLRTLLAESLSRGGDVTVEAQASDGAQAVDIVQRMEPDVLLLDLSMPVLDGLEVLRQVHATTPQTAVVVFSGYGTPELEAACLELGAAAYVKKGTPVGDLRSVIVNVASRNHDLA